jgi:hypothetical protein
MKTAQRGTRKKSGDGSEIGKAIPVKFLQDLAAARFPIQVADKIVTSLVKKEITLPQAKRHAAAHLNARVSVQVMLQY